MLGIFKKSEFMEWNEYSNRIRAMDDFLWSQRVRRNNIRNIGS